MSCTSCLRALPLTVCGEEIIIQEDYPAGNYDIYIKDVTISKTYKQKVTIGGEDGGLSIDLNGFDKSVLMPDHEFEIWVTNRNAGIGAKEDLTFGEGSAAQTTNCISVNFEDVFSDADLIYPIASQIITVE